MEILTPTLLALVPVVIGIIEVLKLAGLPSKYAPFFSLVLGVAGAIAIAGANVEAIIGGIVIGLSSSGLYAGTKASLK